MCDEILDYLFSREGAYSKSYILSAVPLLVSASMPEMYRYNTPLAKWLALINPNVSVTSKIVIVFLVVSLIFALATAVRILGHVINIILDHLESIV